MQATDAVIAEFSVTSLQLDAITMSLEHDDSLATGNSDWILNSETCDGFVAQDTASYERLRATADCPYG